jgi:hypothetical protein
VLIWLLKSSRRPQSLKNLYRSSRFSESTVRNCIHAYVGLGYIVLQSTGGDGRNRFAVATPKLQEMLAMYRLQLTELGRHISGYGAGDVHTTINEAV